MRAALGISIMVPTSYFKVNAGSLDLSVSNLDNDLLDELELLDVADQRES